MVANITHEGAHAARPRPLSVVERLRTELSGAGIDTFRVVKHHDGTVTAGFFWDGDREAGCVFAAQAAHAVEALGYEVVRHGCDFRPGAVTLGFSGYRTPMVQFIPARRTHTPAALPLPIVTGLRVQIALLRYPGFSRPASDYTVLAVTGDTAVVSASGDGAIPLPLSEIKRFMGAPDARFSYGPLKVNGRQAVAVSRCLERLARGGMDGWLRDTIGSILDDSARLLTMEWEAGYALFE